jgi:hypothetical protein
MTSETRTETTEYERAVTDAHERAITRLLFELRVALLGVDPDPDEPRVVQPIGAVTMALTYAADMLAKHGDADDDPESTGECIAEAREAVMRLHDVTTLLESLPDAAFCVMCRRADVVRPNEGEPICWAHQLHCAALSAGEGAR